MKLCTQVFVEYPAEPPGSWAWSILPLEVTQGAQLNAVYLEKNTLDGGHYMAGAFNGTLNISNSVVTSVDGSLFAAKINSSGEVKPFICCPDQVCSKQIKGCISGQLTGCQCLRCISSLLFRVLRAVALQGAEEALPASCT